MKVKVKAYGKVLIFGSYSIIEPGNIGLVVNVDKGTTVEAEESGEGKIVIDMKSFDFKVSGVVDGHKLNLRNEPESVRFLKSAVEHSFLYLNLKGINVRNIRITTVNDSEFQMLSGKKTGLGSSSAATVGTVAAILALHGITDKDIVYKVSFMAHSESQEGRGSGFDISAACYGSQFFVSSEARIHSDFLKYAESRKEIRHEEFYWPASILPIIAFTGRSASTKEMLLKLSAYKGKKEAEYQKFMQSYNQVNLECRQAFLLNDMIKIKETLEKSWEMRKELGDLSKIDIEPKWVSNHLAGLRKSGAFAAGLLGAGGGDSMIALCKTKAEKDAILGYLDKHNLEAVDANFVNKGYEFL